MNTKTRLQASLSRAAAREAPSIGQWLEFPGYQLAKTVASLGEDWVLIDCEHGAITDAEMHLQVAAISSANCSPIVRIPASEPWMMKRALDAGAHGIMVPMCETAEQARSIVAGCKYPPAGIRGAGAMFAHSAFNQNPREYLTTANENIVVIVQIESRKAVENCEEIAGVEGVDMLFVGPNDLASSMGHVAFEHPHIMEVQEAIARVLRAAKGHNKYAGHFALGAEEAARRWKQGFDFVNCGADIVALGACMRNEMEKLKVPLPNQKTDSSPLGQRKLPTNNAAVWVSHRTLAIQDRPITPPGPNEVLVQVISTGICGSDTHNWNNPNVSKELILGHESAGLIVEIGSEVKDRHVGQRVAVEPGFACATCEFCLRGKPNTCANLKYCGLDPTDGTLQQYFTCKANMAIPIPEEISWEEAGAIQPLAIAVQLARRAALNASKTVAIFGCGPLGLLVIAIAKAYGMCKIVVFDIEQSRLDFALSYGADIGVLSPKISENVEPLKFVSEFTSSVVREHNLGHGVDTSVEASGAESSAQMALTILNPGGTCIQAGLGKQLTNVPLFLLTANELTLKGTVRFTPGCYQEAIELVQSKRVDLKPLITETFPLTRAQEAFQAQFERRGIKIVIFNQE